MMKDFCQTVPTDTVESFVEVKLENQGGRAPTMATMEKVRGVGKTVYNAPSKDKTSLIGTDQGRDEGLEPRGENFGETFNSSVLQGNWTKVTRVASFIFLGEEHEVRHVNAAEISVVEVKVLEEPNKRVGGDGPGTLKEERAEAVGARASIGVHAVNGIFDFIVAEGGTEVAEVKRPLRIQRIQVKRPSSGSFSAHQILIENMQNVRFPFMRVVLYAIVLDNLNPIFTSPLIGTSMKIACVFITMNCSFDFASLFPD